MEKVKKSKKRTALKIIAVILGLWVLITAIDAVRFFTSDKQISPIIRTEYNSKDGWHSEVGMGYSFHYEYDSPESYSARTPDRAVYYFSGTRYKRK